MCSTWMRGFEGKPGGVRSPGRGEEAVVSALLKPSGTRCVRLPRSRVVLNHGPVLGEKYLEPLFAVFKDVSGHYFMRSERDGFGWQPRLAEDVRIEAIANRDRVHADYQRQCRYDPHRPYSPDDGGYLETCDLQ